MMALGILGAVRGDFTPLWSGVPKGITGRMALAYLCAAIALVSGTALLWRRTALVASRVLLASFLLWLLVIRLPVILRAPTSTGPWWAGGNTAVVLAAAWVLCTRFADHAKLADGNPSLRMARMLYGLGLIPFGVAHFTFLARTVSMVPPWMPWHLAWAIVTGCAFILAGVAVLIGVHARLAATLSALQLSLFTLLVWIPVVLTGHPRPSDWTEFVTSWFLTASAWVVADSYRGAPWLAVDRQPAPTLA